MLELENELFFRKAGKCLFKQLESASNEFRWILFDSRSVTFVSYEINREFSGIKWNSSWNTVESDFGEIKKLTKNKTVATIGPVLSLVKSWIVKTHHVGQLKVTAILIGCLTGDPVNCWGWLDWGEENDAWEFHLKITFFQKLKLKQKSKQNISKITTRKKFKVSLLWFFS